MSIIIKQQLEKNHREWLGSIGWLNDLFETTYLEEEFADFCKPLSNDQSFIKKCFEFQGNKPILYHHVLDHFSKIDDVKEEYIERYTQRYITEWYDFSRGERFFRKENLYYDFASGSLYKLQAHSIEQIEKINPSSVSQFVDSLHYRSILHGVNTLLLNNMYLVYLHRPKNINAGLFVLSMDDGYISNSELEKSGVNYCNVPLYQKYLQMFHLAKAEERTCIFYRNVEDQDLLNLMFASKGVDLSNILFFPFEEFNDIKIMLLRFSRFCLFDVKIEEREQAFAICGTNDISCVVDERV